jgi:hypothetical protein
MEFSFTETIRFTRRLFRCLDDDEYSRLQNLLLKKPTAGSVIPGGGGLRKLRWAASGRGKRGGARVIYYLALSYGRILLLDIYAKNQQADLTKDELKTLQRQSEEWLESL